MHQPQRKRAHELLQAKGIDHALFADPVSIAWLTGFAPTLQLVAHPFAGTPLLLWYARGAYTLILADGHAGAAKDVVREGDCALLTYPGLPFLSPALRQGMLHDALAKVWDAAKDKGGRTGIEQVYVPAVVAKLLEKQTQPAEIVAIDEWLAPLRAVKTNEEIARLRALFDLTGVGHAAARKVVQAGMREIDVWTEVHGAIQRAAGGIVALGSDCVVGRREFNVGGWPSTKQLIEGDSLIVDLSVVRDGYWSDSCATYVVGEPSQQLRKMHAIATEALAFGATLLRPGAVAGEIDASLREFMAERGMPVYTHHSGHGVGASGHEIPRIIPGSPDVLEAGMVVMLEPGIYFPRVAGVRVEDAFLISREGASQLTYHDKSLTT